MHTHRVLFVTWDGPDQAYLESLFLPIFARLGTQGFAFDVLQYSWAPTDALDSAGRACRELGIGYSGHRAARGIGPLGVLATVVAGAAEVRRLASEYSVVIPRSILPAAMVLASPVGRARLLFDADGLSADERVETVGWRDDGPFYGIYREIERAALTHSRAVITRTEASREILRARAGPGLADERIHIVPNGSDEIRFSPRSPAQRRATRHAMGVPDDAPWFVSAGSVGPQYLPEMQMQLFRRIAERRTDARFSVLTGRPDLVDSSWRAALGDRLDVRRVSPERMGDILGAADVGIALRLPSFSQRAVSPIKVSEYLLAGLPVVATRGVGDLDSILSAESLAAMLVDAANPDLDGAATWAVVAATSRRADAGAAARRLGLAQYSLSLCVARYSRALRYAIEGTA